MSLKQSLSHRLSFGELQVSILHGIALDSEKFEYITLGSFSRCQEKPEEFQFRSAFTEAEPIWMTTLQISHRAFQIPGYHDA